MFKFKAQPKLFLITVLVLGILIYKSPDEAWWYRKNTQEAIRIGRLCAFYLLNNYKDGLLRISTEPAMTKIIDSSLKSTSFVEMNEQLEKKKINISLTAPLYADQKDENMELIAYERLESFIVMTFVYKGWNEEITEIPGQGGMLFSIALRYYNPIDDRTVTKLIRKIANLPLVRNFAGNLGTRGRWLVFDYYYAYNSDDYFKWLLKGGENYSNKTLEKSENLLEQIGNKKFNDEFIESVDSGVDFLYEWGASAIKGQPDRFNKLYRMLREVQNSIKFEEVK